jgi:hypothetical protein
MAGRGLTAGAARSPVDYRIEKGRCGDAGPASGRPKDIIARWRGPRRTSDTHTRPLWHRWPRESWPGHTRDIEGSPRRRRAGSPSPEGSGGAVWTGAAVGRSAGSRPHLGETYPRLIWPGDRLPSSQRPGARWARSRSLRNRGSGNTAHTPFATRAAPQVLCTHCRDGRWVTAGCVDSGYSCRPPQEGPALYQVLHASSEHSRT